jgi:hypothetical protein
MASKRARERAQELTVISYTHHFENQFYKRLALTRYYRRKIDENNEGIVVSFGNARTAESVVYRNMYRHMKVATILAVRNECNKRQSERERKMRKELTTIGKPEISCEAFFAMCV